MKDSDRLNMSAIGDEWSSDHQERHTSQYVCSSAAVSESIYPINQLLH